MKMYIYSYMWIYFRLNFIFNRGSSTIAGTKFRTKFLGVCSFS
jgi:hypothetical protein